MEWLDNWLKLFGKTATGYTPVEFEIKISAVGGRIFPYIGTINPAVGWVFSVSQDDFIGIINFDVSEDGGRPKMVQKSGKTYYYLALNGASFRCILP
jgi:hypothetical protein